MKDPLQPEKCARKLGALAAPERLRIVRFLRNTSHNVTEIAAMLKAAPVNVSHHLSVLRRAGLVKSKKQGRFVVYSLPATLINEDEQIDLGYCKIEIPWSDPNAKGESKRLVGAAAATTADDED